MIDFLNYSNQPRYGLITLLILLIVGEMIWSYRNNKHVYELRDTLTNLVIFAGFQLSKLAFFGIELSIGAFFTRHELFHLEKNTWVFVSCFILVDFVYYWYHRLSHKIKFLWAFHLIHHSSLYMNLTVSYRLNWLSTVLTPFIYAPLLLLGFPIEFILLSLALNLVYQFFLHTEAIGKLGFIEYIFNTPSAHRVHHGSNERYIDKNFGGFLIIWDLLFNSYERETIKATYGTTTGFIGYNPLKLNFKGFIDLFKSKMTYKG
ncbi:sterol desaturase family protein [Zunongwangia pacifica]|uniref:Sterol desaturase family protein n=1 Tax=Zunongwangia pacifica TaxID=2911062 RepID=A0A9X2CLT5_9FLAO|nr:sterol desaturase family protein [Zunongwangia pacifica]MCL6220381.1 sterol desaturase family protein [Zunongwangia pacifica]